VATIESENDANPKQSGGHFRLSCWYRVNWWVSIMVFVWFKKSQILGHKDKPLLGSILMRLRKPRTSTHMTNPFLRVAEPDSE
jgi:hypothetical protein